MQISKEKSNIYNGKNSSDIYFLSNIKNEESCISKLIDSQLKLNPKKIIFAVDSSTTDKTVEIIESYKESRIEHFFFRWQHDFSYPKNLLAKMVPIGSWCFQLGGDMRIPDESIQGIKEFTEEPLNVLGRLEIEDIVNEQSFRKPAKRFRTLLWRSHPLIYWEDFVHEEMVWSAYRLLRIGMAFNKDDHIPTIGKLEHLDLLVTSKEEWEEKSFYYIVLWEIQRTLAKLRIPKDNKSMVEMVSSLTGLDLDKGIKKLMENIKTGQRQQGIFEEYQRWLNRENQDAEYDY